MSQKMTTDDDMREQGWILCSEAARLTGKAVQTICRWIDDDSTEVEGFRDNYRRYVRWNTMLDHLGPAFVKAKKLSRI